MPNNTKGSFITKAAPGMVFVVISIFMLVSSCSSTIKVPTNRFALAIGIADYVSATPLIYTVKDATDMGSLLIDQGWTDVALLTNSAATKAGIVSAIQALISKAAADEDSSNATILVYYSGHGDSENGVSYICPSDTTFTGGIPNVSSMISVAELYQLFAQVSCKNKLLILDSCYSGGFVDTGSSIDVSPQNTNVSGTNDASVFFSALADANTLLAASCSAQADPSIVTISACGSEELSYDAGKYQNGAFTYFLMQSATHADSSGKGYVTATEAYAYAKKLLKYSWDVDATNPLSGIYGWLLLPHISGGSGDLVLFVNQ